MKNLTKILGIAFILSISTTYAHSSDVAKGKSVFNKCKACHSLAAGKNGIGPSLAGLFGRKAGTAGNYKFSKAMQDAGGKGLVWDEKTLADYLKKPRDYVKGTKMTFAGLNKASDLENIIAFLKDATK
jgi:cytochrome c2